LGNQQNLGLNGNGRLWAQNEGKHSRDVSFITPRVFPAICWPKIARARKIITGGYFFSFYLYLAIRSEATLAVGFVEAPLVAISGATLGLAAAGGFLDSASWIPPWLL
jgi:hypothetical protein